MTSFDTIMPDLVWAGIAENLSTLVGTWWEDEQVVDQLNALRRVR